MMPLLITLETALLNGIEHSDKQWKHIFALPVPRHSVYFAKVVVAQALIFTSTFILGLLTVIVGVANIYLRPELANAWASSLPLDWEIRGAGLDLRLADHCDSHVGQHPLAGFPIALGTGIGGTFFDLFAASATLGEYYPWLLPMNIFLEGRFASAIVLGAARGIVGALVGCLSLSGATWVSELPQISSYGSMSITDLSADLVDRFHDRRSHCGGE